MLTTIKNLTVAILERIAYIFGEALSADTNEIDREIDESRKSNPIWWNLAKNRLDDGTDPDGVYDIFDPYCDGEMVNQDDGLEIHSLN